MIGTLVALVLAAVLEIGGDAAMRTGLVRGAAGWLAVGAALLVSYGITVNSDRSMDFGRLMGVYIAVFFVVSQGIAWAVFGGTPSWTLVVGGLFIVIGGVVIQLGTGT